MEPTRQHRKLLYIKRLHPTQHHLLLLQTSRLHNQMIDLLLGLQTGYNKTNTLSKDHEGSYTRILSAMHLFEIGSFCWEVILCSSLMRMSGTLH